MAQERSGRRNKVVLASKITGGSNINKRSIREDCEGSLKRLGVDTLDVYLLHWPARYTPQSNWGARRRVEASTPRHRRDPHGSIAGVRLGPGRHHGAERGVVPRDCRCHGRADQGFAGKIIRVASMAYRTGKISLQRQRGRFDGCAARCSASGARACPGRSAWRTTTRYGTARIGGRTAFCMQNDFGDRQ